MTVKIALLNEKMGAEELGIMIKAKEAGMDIESVNAKTLLFTQNINTNYDIYINRCKSANRRTKISEFLQSLELPVINTGTVEKISNDKALTSLLLNKYHIQVPVFNWEGNIYLRYSIQAYNTHSDMEKLLFAVKELLS